MGKPKKNQSSDPNAKSPAAKAQDDQVMGTNSSSIVSKRSVEKTYYPSEPPFFRYFVSKYQRRAPLINRGYWLRLRVIDVLVRDFLKRPLREGKQRKVVVNLGAGSDVLPWQCLTRYGKECEGVKFVDVDFLELMERKKGVVMGEEGLRGWLTNVRLPRAVEEVEKVVVVEGGKEVERERKVVRKGPVVLDSEQYSQVGVDLRDLKTLERAMGEVLGAGWKEECEFIFVAEVSITYMEREGADGVIKWASTVGDAEFALLEQVLVDGREHPFARTMLSHFDKLNTQLKSVEVYPTVGDQYRRFGERGWEEVRVWTLWQAWGDETFLSKEERVGLDEVEEFDEWEEFALFGSHYCVVRARTVGERCSAPVVHSALEIPAVKVQTQVDETTGTRGQRRFAAALQISQEGRQSEVVNVLGLGTRNRLQSCDLFTQGEASGLTFGEGGPTSRMCHSLVDLGESVLLVGGRGPPSSPLKDCWLFEKKTNTWTRTHDLPVPLYRPAATALGSSGMALLVNGRGKASTFDGCLLYHLEKGWIECDIRGDTFAARYGGVLGVKSSNTAATFSGIHAGGLVDALFTEEVVSWKLDISDLKKPVVTFTRLQPSPGSNRDASSWLVARFGATCIQHGDEFILLGGVARDHLLGYNDEIVAFSVTGTEFKVTRRLVSNVSPRALYTGHSAAVTADGRIVVVGGGATCFSMGTFWNKGVYSLRLPGLDTAEPLPHWVHDKTVDIIPGERSLPIQTKSQNGDSSIGIKTIERMQLKTADDFAKIVRSGRPVVLEGLDLGSCVASWDLKYLAEKVGSKRKVVAHEAATQVMDFNAKNFRYVTTEFGDLAQKIEQGGRLYLRALSHEKPTEKPSVLADDFPTLAGDFVLPEQLALVSENLFSSVLRLSGPVNMWLHYDVMANVYCQIGGSKRLILFPPSDVAHLSFPPGASSSSIDVFSSLGSPELAQTHPHEAVLGPGEVLFLPPLWLHTATPTSDKSVAVNVFFRDLDKNSYAAGRDVYGNRDLAAYERGRQDIGRIANSFQKLPAEARQFYLLRLTDELRRKARG
ncbi:putative leucine carboxyl methyltransferase 2 [Triangularia setosa]|uniref:tRNA wybutosine-synthesizing protein 4 n=1 Tax=Triangularia setosa TaxID=2587417 RepID=A0AAN7AB48_9PEZI|nr:putative leucine carboxyl methyltransferase 2 [Podospora setosa]